MIIPLIISALTLLITLIIASVQDACTRTVYKITWYPAAVIGIVCVIIYWATTLPINIPALIISLIFAGMMAAFGILGLFGKADAKALALISLCVPVSPIVSALFPSVALATLVNAGALVLIFALVCLIYNLIKRNKAPFLLMCSGYPVNGGDILKHHGFIAEIIEKKNGKIERTFRKAHTSISALRSGSETMIQTLRDNPEQYREQLAIYRSCDRIWITAGIPLIIPITLGFITVLCGISLIDLVLNLLI